MRSQRVIAVLWMAFAAACGARTGLYAPEEDASVDAGHDAHDAKKDTADAQDVQDVVFPDVPIVSACPDAGETLVYVLGTESQLYSFNPPTLQFSKITDSIACPSGSGPNSMAITRSGIAFTSFHDGNLFEVSTANGACKATTYLSNQLGWTTYGMGYVADSDGGETLYVAGLGSMQSKGLGTIDTTSFLLSEISDFQPPQFNCELTGTGAGDLYGFCPFGSGAWLIQIDKTNASVISSHQISAGGNNVSWAFAFWGGDFWLFTNDVVTKYDPAAQTETQVATAPFNVVGAGVSTCAPL